jgi:hypothetical protein
VAQRSGQESLPIAVATIGAFLATLVVLLAGTAQGTRPWILLMRAGGAFLLVSTILKLLTAGLIQVISWRRSSAPAKAAMDDALDTIQTITSHARSTDLKPKGVS